MSTTRRVGTIEGEIGDAVIHAATLWILNGLGPERGLEEFFLNMLSKFQTHFPARGEGSCSATYAGLEKWSWTSQNSKTQ